MELLWALVISVSASLITFFVTNIWYLKRKEKRQEKIVIFKILMSTRNVQDYGAVKALNSIDVVFEDCDAVLSAWHRYRKALRVDGEVTPEKRREIEQSEKKLYEAMASCLGYKKITWDIIEQPHYPIWLSERERSYRYQDMYWEQVVTAKPVTNQEGEKNEQYR